MNYIKVSNEDKAVIKHATNPYFPTNSKPGSEDSGFDMTMGVYDGAEACELIGVFILSQLS